MESNIPERAAERKYSAFKQGVNSQLAESNSERITKDDFTGLSLYISILVPYYLSKQQSLFSICSYPFIINYRAVYKTSGGFFYLL